MKKMFIHLFLFVILINFSSAKDTKIEILYFHATIRCHACLTIEEYTGNILKTRFQKEMDNGLFKFNSIDFLEEKNEHYQQDYQIDTQSLILSKKEDGKEVKWKNLDKIWDYYYDFNKFEKYITEEINQFIKD
jgi:hypothetical protein